MTKICGLIAMAGIAASSNAAVVGLDMMVSTDGGATWSSSANVTAGSVVTVGIFTRHDASVYGFAGAVCRINGSGLAAGDAAGITGVDSRIAPFNFGASNQAIFASAGAFRIDGAADAANSASVGVSISQRDPSSGGPSYQSNSGAIGYMFTVSVGADATIRSIALSIDQIKNGVMTRHNLIGSTSGSSTTDWTVTGASINVVPTPASLALVGLGGLVAGRRRR